MNHNLSCPWPSPEPRQALPKLFRQLTQELVAFPFPAFWGLFGLGPLLAQDLEAALGQKDWDRS